MGVVSLLWKVTIGDRRTSLTVCVLTNEKIEFCWPFLGRETERRNLSMNKGMISEGRGKLGYHNMGSLKHQECQNINGVHRARSY